MEVETTSKKLRELLDRFARGEIWLPQFQRDYVWPARKVRNLLDSLWRQLPVGGFYLWRPEAPEPIPIKKGDRAAFFAGFLIDGQQRLTGLEAAYGLYSGEDKGKEQLDCYLDLAVPDTKAARDTRLFVTRAQKRSISKRLAAADPTLVPLEDLWHADEMEYCEQVRSQLETLPGWNAKKVADAISRLKNAFRMLDQLVPCTTLHRLSTEQAVEVFRRLNKGGVALREADLEAAELAQHGAYEILERIRQFVNEEYPRRLGLTFSFAFRALVLFHRESADLDELPAKWVTLPGPNGRRLEDSWEAASKALSAALRFAREIMGWSRRKLVPSLNALIVLAAALDKRPDVDENSEMLYRRWLCLTALRQTFSGSVATTINRFYHAVREHKGKPAHALLDALKRHERARLRDRDFLAESQPWGAATQVIYSWLVNHGAADWVEPAPLSDLAQGPFSESLMGDLTVHHLFPRRLVADLMGDPNEANTPANYALVGRSTNLALKDKSPKEALSLLTPEQLNRASVQFFGPEARDMLDADSAQCEQFWKWRANRLVTAINQWLGLA